MGTPDHADPEAGRHFKYLLNGTGEGSRDRLRDPVLVRGFMLAIVKMLGMRSLGEPVTYEVREEIKRMGAEPYEDEGGVTSVVVLSTSHAAIHTWPLRGRAVLDVYSCREFDPRAVLELCAVSFLAEIQGTDLSGSLAWETQETAPDEPPEQPS